MSKIKLITDAAALAKEAKNLGIAIKRNDTRVQKYLVSEIAHIEQHRNPTRLNDFLSGIKGKGVRSVAMHSFIQTFANVVWDAEGEKYKVKVKRSKELADKALEGAMAVMWTDHKPEQQVQQWSFDAKLKQLLDQAHKKMKAISDEKDPAKKKAKAAAYNIDLDLLTSVEKIVIKEDETDDTKERAEAVALAEASKAS